MRRSRSVRAVLTAATLTLACLGAPGVAYAGDAAVAEQLFSDGLAAMKAERWQAACEAFAGSNDADPSPGTQINLGVCHEKQKLYATALTWFDAAARLAEEQGRDDRARLARSEHARVAPKVHYVNVTASSPVAGATITRDGKRLPATAMLGRDTPLDPGKHTFTLEARGKKPITQELVVPDAPGKSAVAFPAMEDAPVGASGEGAVGGGDYTPVVVNDGSSQRTVGIVVGGTGVLGLLAAGGLQLLALDQDSKAAERRKESQDPSRSAEDSQRLANSARSHQDAAGLDQLLAIVTGAGGVVLVGVGAFLYFTAPSGKAATTTAGITPRVAPMVAPRLAGLSLGGTF